MAIKYLNAITINGSGGTVLDVQGSQGQLFSVTDSLTGDIFAVSDISGVPIFTVNSSGVSYFDGNVGIGTTSPVSHSAARKTLIISDATDGANIEIWGNASGKSILQSVNADTYVGNLVGPTGTTYILSGSGSVAMTALSTGNVGIGNTAPDSKIQIEAKNASNVIYAGLRVGYNATSNNYYDADNHHFRNGLGATNKVIINSAGAIQFNSYSSTNNTGTPTYLLGTDASGNIVKTNTVPGSAAGPYLPLAGGAMANTNLVTNMNADLLDGLNASQFLRSDTADTSTGEILFDAGFKSDSILLSGAQNFDNIARSGFYNLYETSAGSTNSPPLTYGTMIVVGGNKAYRTFGLQIAHERTGAGMYVRGMNDSGTWYAWDEIWNSGNDGAGSGLDADLLDGQQGSYYVNTATAQTIGGTKTFSSAIIAPGGNSTEWNTAYDDSITALAFSSGSTTTLTLNQQDGGTVYNTFINPQGTVVGATSTNLNTITVSASNTSPAITAVTAAVSSGSSALATGAQIQTAINTALLGVLSYQGTWNASTNSPTLASGTGTPGYYYIVSVAGSTNLDGITDWAVGDWAVFSDLATDAWQKIDNTQVGNVTGSGAAGRVAYWNSSSNITSDADLTFDGANLTVTGDVTADQFMSTNNGAGFNYRIGDDAWIGDINVADTFRVTGNQNNNNGYITFGNSSNQALGRAGTGALTWDGNFTISGGDLILGGTGRIQGVDTVSASTDAANKAYVDAHVSPAGTYLPLLGGTMTGNTIHNDNVKSIYGTASDGLEIYHDGTDSIIADTGTGNLYIRGAASMRLQGINQSNFFIATQGGSVNLYYNNANKLDTTNTGINVTGDIRLNAKALLSNQENTDVDTGTEVVANVAIASYTAAFFDFVIKKTTNVRSGTVYACHDGTNVVYTETSTNDLGDTSDVTLSVDISGGNMRLLATTTSDDWSVKSLIRAI